MSHRNSTPPRVASGAVDRTRRELIGRVRAVRNYDPATGFYVATLTDGTSIVGEVDLTGDDAIEIGVQYRFRGRWTENARYGTQFRFDMHTIDRDAGEKGVLKYLERTSGGTIHEPRAKKLWAAYGQDVLRVIRDEPERVHADGLAESLWHAAELSKRFTMAMDFERTEIDLWELFAGKGFPRGAIKDCIARWGVRAAEVVRANPFEMLKAHIEGVGFKRADNLYIELGLDPTRLERQMYAAWDTLRSDGEGHTWHVEGAARKAICSCVGLAAARFDDAIALGKSMDLLTTRTDADGKLWLTETHKARAERRVAVELLRLQAGGRLYWPAGIDADSPLTSHQRERVMSALTGPVAILGGCPGTGKTFVAGWLLSELQGRVGGPRNIAVVAPTGKAAVRITEAMRGHGLDITGTTIHRLLEIGGNGHANNGDWSFRRNRSNPLPHIVVVVDEASMCDVALFGSLLEALPDGCNLLIVGDTHQLPPVGHGAPLRDLIAAGVPSAMLTEIMRTAAGSSIVKACHAIAAGKRWTAADRFDEEAGLNLRHVVADDPEAQLTTLRQLVATLKAGAKFDPMNDVQVLCARNEATPVSREPLNELLQGLLNPPTGDDADPSTPKLPFRIGDRIICLRNSFMTEYHKVSADDRDDDATNYAFTPDEAGDKKETFIANGDMGRVLAVGEKEIVTRFVSPDRIVKIVMSKAMRDASADAPTKAEGGVAADFALAYAVTVHKSQGSEWPCVVVMLDEGAGAGGVACREHLYTAISRAKRLCVLIGKRSTADKQTRKVALPKRVTMLVEIIAELQGRGRKAKGPQQHDAANDADGTPNTSAFAAHAGGSDPDDVTTTTATSATLFDLAAEVAAL